MWVRLPPALPIPSSGVFLLLPPAAVLTNLLPNCSPPCTVRLPASLLALIRPSFYWFERLGKHPTGRPPGQLQPGSGQDNIFTEYNQLLLTDDHWQVDGQGSNFHKIRRTTVVLITLVDVTIRIHPADPSWVDQGSWSI